MPAFIVRDHRLWIGNAPVPFVPTPNMGGRMEPALIVAHDTAGRLDGHSSVAWLANPAAKASAHVVIHRDGSVTQMVPFDRVAWHCGQSSWRGAGNVNGRSIGIEVDNPGRLTGTPERAVAWFGQAFTFAEGVQWAASEACGEGFWMNYTEAQIATFEAIVAACAAAYPTVAEIVGHHDIAPGRKVDPCPLFPFARVRRALGNRKPLPEDAVADVQKELAALGYWPGSVDGHMGPRTRSALRDFQEQNGLPLTGQPDGRTIAVLFSEEAKPMVTGGREDVTAKDLRQAGSVQAIGAAIQKRGAEVLIAAGGTVAVNGASAPAPPIRSDDAASTMDVIAKAGEAVAKAETVKGLGSRVVALGDGLLHLVTTPVGVLALIVLVCGALIWWQGHRQERARVRAARSGQHVGV